MALRTGLSVLLRRSALVAGMGVGLAVSLRAMLVRFCRMLMGGSGMRLCRLMAAFGVMLRRLAVMLGCRLMVSCNNSGRFR